MTRFRQAHRLGEISELATSFRNAGLCITETDEMAGQKRSTTTDVPIDRARRWPRGSVV